MATTKNEDVMRQLEKKEEKPKEVGEYDSNQLVMSIMGVVLGAVVVILGVVLMIVDSDISKIIISLFGGYTIWVSIVGINASKRDSIDKKMEERAQAKEDAQKR